MRSLSPSRFLAHRKAILAALMLVVVLGVITLWLARTTTLGWLMEGVLASRHLGPADVEVLELDAKHATLVLRGSALGNIERVKVDYRLNLATGVRVERVRVTGARLQLAWRDGQLLPALGGAGDAASAPDLTIELADTRIDLRVGTTVVKAEVAGELRSGGQPAAKLRFTIDAPQGHVRGAFAGHTRSDGDLAGKLVLDDGQFALGTLAARGVTGEIQLRGSTQGLSALDGRIAIAQLTSPQQAWGAATITVAQSSATALVLSLRSTPLRVSLRAAQSAASSKRHLSLDGSLDMRTLAALWPDLHIGAGSLKLQATAELPPTLASLQEWLAAGTAQASLQLDASALVLPEIAQIDTVNAAVSCAFAAGALSCSAAQDLKVDGMTLATPLAADDSLLAGRAALVITAQDAAPLVTLTRQHHGAALSVIGKVSLVMPQLLVRTPLTVRISLDTSTAPLTGHFAVGGTIDAESPPGQAWLAPRFALQGQYSADALSHTLQSITLHDGTLELSAQGWLATGLKGLYVSAATDTFKFGIDQLRSTREPALLVPLKAELAARVSATQASFSGSLRDAARRFDVNLSGQHQRRSGHGEAHLVLQPIVLTGQHSLRTLAPALATRITSAHGELSANGAAQWGEGEPRSQLSLALHDVALVGPALKVAKLNARLALDGLAPLHSASGQTLNASLQLPALQQVPVDLRFNIADNRLHIEHARAELFDGAFETSDGSIAIGSGASRIDLRVVDVDLASAFKVLDLEQLKGSGRLSGRLPLHFEDGHIAIEQGQLAASGPGVVQIGASALTDQLQSYGRDVDLAFRVLSDFHYQSLSIAADKSLRGAGKALFHLEGDSPAVMAGQPFVFNISLETDFDYLAKLLLDLSGITNSALGWGAGEMIKR